MHVPTVTDQQLDEVLQKAASPVVVIFLGSPDRSRDALWRWRMSVIANTWDDRVIFCQISAIENPEISIRLRATTGDDGLVDLPLIKVYLRGEQFGTCIDCSQQTIDEMLNRVMKVRR